MVLINRKTIAKGTFRVLLQLFVLLVNTCSKIILMRKKREKRRIGLIQDFPKALAKVANIAWQTLLFVSESLAMNKKETPDLGRKQ